jgi:hypothetical protein
MPTRQFRKISLYNKKIRQRLIQPFFTEEYRHAFQKKVELFIFAKQRNKYCAKG